MTLRQLLSDEVMMWIHNKNLEIKEGAKYSKEDDEFEVLNKIEIPLFMRWGNINELIKREASNQVEFMRNKIKNNKKDIDFIDEANHSYDGKEQVLAEQICDFFKY